MALAQKKEIPDYLLADAIAPELIWETGSLGSPVLALRGGDPDILERMADRYAERFRKGWRDLKNGIAVFMAPSRDHEYSKGDVRTGVEALAAALGLAVVNVGSATLRGDDSSKRQGDPDESFFIGPAAARYRAIERRDGTEAARAALADTPADLAVEVEHTHYDATKRTIYRAAGVAELWEIATAPTGKETAIVDLQASGGPQSVETSAVVPGVHAVGLDEALQVLREIGGYGEFMRALGGGEPVAERLLAAAGVVVPKG